MKLIIRICTLVLLFIPIIKITAQDFEVAPVKLYFVAEPGQTQTISVTIMNHSNKKEAFVMQLGDFVVNKEGQHIQMPAASTEHTLVNWLSINPPFIEINPNETRQVLVSIQAPTGDYSTKWANIFVTPSAEQTAFNVDKGTQAGLIVTAQIVLKAYQSPRSNINYKMKINNLSEITVPSDSVRTFQANVDNLGDKITHCKVTLLASDLTTAQDIILSDISFESFPDSQRLIALKMKNVLPPGKYALAAILDYGDKNNLEGAQMLIEVK